MDFFDKTGCGKQARKVEAIEIVPYEPRFKEAFCTLNKEWITM